MMALESHSLLAVVFKAGDAVPYLVCELKKLL
jgi:hypothetical protein